MKNVGVRLNPEKVIWSLIVKFLAIESAFFSDSA